MRELWCRGKSVQDGSWMNGYYCKMNETTYAFEEDYKTRTSSGFMRLTPIRSGCIRERRTRTRKGFMRVTSCGIGAQEKS